MHPKLSKLVLILAVNALLFATSPSATAYVIQVFGPPGPAGYGEFYQSNQSPAADPSCNCVDGGVSVFNGTDVQAAYNAWVTSVFTRHGILPGDFFSEDFDGPGWTHNQVFDSQEPPGGAPAIAAGTRDPAKLGADMPAAQAKPRAHRESDSASPVERGYPRHRLSAGDSVSRYEALSTRRIPESAKDRSPLKLLAMRSASR